MRALLAVRLYSGFETSVASRRWRPTGAPTIYRLVEGLDRDDSLTFVLTRKGTTDPADPSECRDDVMTLEGLAAPVCVLAHERALPAWLGRLRWYGAELLQAWKIGRLQRRVHADLVYVDRANLLAGGMLARVSRTPVVLRVMGVSSDMELATTSRHPRHLLNRWLLRSPFAAVVCTLDGSGTETWAEKALSPTVPRMHFVNGIERESPGGAGPPLPNDQTIVLCAGRLEPIKGCVEFLRAFVAACREQPTGLRAVFMGTGALERELSDLAEQEGVTDRVTFLGAVPHKDVHAVYRRADIYVSLNRMGSLSNTTIEALDAGCCIVLPRSDPATGRDISTDRLLPDDVAVRIPSVDDTQALAQVLVALHRDPARRHARAKAAAVLARRVIPTWHERIERELTLLRGIAAGVRPTLAPGSAPGTGPA